jgi:type IV secretion system pilin
MFRIHARLRALTHHTTTRRARLVAHLATIALILSVPDTAFADPTGPVYLAANTLPQVIANLQSWIMGILAAVATLFLVLAGVYWATAGGDPAQVDKAKGALRNALIGYGLAVLAPVLLQVVKGIVGG